MCGWHRRTHIPLPASNSFDQGGEEALQAEVGVRKYINGPVESQDGVCDYRKVVELVQHESVMTRCRASYLRTQC